jgi:dihydrofolate reductase
MRRVVVQEFVSLDGVAQAPGGSEEDTSEGFAHGGWHMGYLDDAARSWIVDCLTGADGYLLGRRTYEIFAGYWPKAPDEEQVIAEPLNTRPKYVVSTTLSDPLPWHNSTVVAPDALADLKRDGDGYLLVIGSLVLVHTLVEHGLVDQFQVMVDPVLLGGGKRIFPEDRVRRALRLVHHDVTTTGAVLATYEPVP